MKTLLFEFPLPETFEIERDDALLCQIAPPDYPHDFQPPFFRAMLTRQNFYEDHFEGETLEDKLFTAFLENLFRGEEVRREVREFNGFPFLEFEGKIESEWQGDPIHVRSLHFAFLIGGAFVLTIWAIAETQVWEKFEPIFRNTLEEITFETDLKIIEAVVARAEEEDAEDWSYADAIDDDEKEERPIVIPEFRPPETGKHQITINGIDCTFHENAEVTIPDYGHGSDLYVHLEFNIPEKANMPENILHSDQCYLRFFANQLTQTENPEALYQFKFGNEVDHKNTLWSSGLAAKFSGEIRIQDGWVAILGELENEWIDEANVPIEAYWKIDLPSLNWANYKFQSLAETADVSIETVRYLTLTEPSLEKSEWEQLHQFSNLTHLSISRSASPVHLDCSNFPHLINLSISQSQVTLDGLEACSELKQFFLLSCSIDALSPEVWTLPSVEYLWLPDLALKEVPPSISLPLVKTIHLSKNQLTTLPDITTNCPHLSTLKLEDNPWESLPQKLLDISTLDLPIEEKLRLFDYSYPDHDGTGLASWDDRVYHLDPSSEIGEALKAHIAKQIDEKSRQASFAMARHSVAFTQVESTEGNRLGRTRFGGMPDLPPDWDYPTFEYEDESYPYEFIGQYDCAALAHLQDYLPREGFLYFFYESIHLGGGKVLYFEGIRDELASGDRFDIDADDYFEMVDPAYEVIEVTSSIEPSLPYLYASYTNKHLYRGEAAELMEWDRDQIETLDDHISELRDLLESEQSEKGDFFLNHHAFTQHEAPELQASLAKRGLPEDWMILLTATSAGDMSWGDAGDLFFVIHKSDLAKRDFSRIFVTMESS